MGPILSAIVSLLFFRFRRRASLELEVIALRHQLAVLQRRETRRVELSGLDRIFWIILYRLWPKIVQSMVLVKPVTVIKWHYMGFRLYWGYGSRNYYQGPKHIGIEARDLIYQMKRDNPLWGRHRIAAELVKLGFKISPSTVGRYLQKQARFPSPSPGWKIFLANHIRDTAAVDFFVMVIVTFQLLYAMVLLGHPRRNDETITSPVHASPPRSNNNICGSG